MRRLMFAKFAPLLCAAGCASMTPTEQGLLGGGAVGGTAGAIIGNAVGDPAAGAVIGAGLGAVAGGLTGNAIEESEKRTAVQAAAVQQASVRPAPLGVTDVAQMTQQGISDAIIVQQIRNTGSMYQLSPTDIQWLKNNGVSDVVILEMQATAQRVKPVVVQPRPVRPVYIVEDPWYAPPPPGLHFGYTYRRCR